MKKIIIIALLVSIFLITGCLDNYVPLEKHNQLQETLNETIGEYGSLKKENTELINENSNLEEELNLTEEQLEKYQNLVNNLNSLLENVYYGYASNSNWVSDGFTAFSMEYEGKTYLVTAGHCVHYVDDKIDTGVYTYFKFKANFSDEFIYPELIAYDKNKEYAVFISDKINKGLAIDNENQYLKSSECFILGNEDVGLNIFRPNSSKKQGESGSPIISQNGKVVGIAAWGMGYTPIGLVIKAIDKIR